MNFDDRAYIPVEAMGIMTARTIGNSHPVLLDVLEREMSVLDVGCGPGTLTAEIAERVHPGHVVGMDVNPEMVQTAEATYPPAQIPNLVFYAADVRQSEWDQEFDLVTATRVLQWIPDPERALSRMGRAARRGGLIVVLDYDHTRAEWSDAPPVWARFYTAFLRWRESGGLDNAIAGRLAALCVEAGLDVIDVTPHVTTVSSEDPDFFRVAGLWRMVIESRGRQMVAAGHLPERQRGDAFEAFTEWMTRTNARQTLHETCVVARRP